MPHNAIGKAWSQSPLCCDDAIIMIKMKRLKRRLTLNQISQMTTGTGTSLISSARYVGLAGSGLGEGSKLTPRQKFSVTSVGVIFSQWGVKPPNPPQTNRTLVITYTYGGRQNLTLCNFILPPLIMTKLGRPTFDYFRDPYANTNVRRIWFSGESPNQMVRYNLFDLL